MRWALLFLIITLIAVINTKAEIIITTLDSGDDLLAEDVGNCLAPSGQNKQRAIGFTTPNNKIVLENLVLRLENSSIGGTPIVTLNADDSNGQEPGSILATFINPVLNDTRGDYLFILPTAYTLDPNTRYYLEVDHSDNLKCFQWISGSSLNPGKPTGIASILNGNLFSQDDGANYGFTGPLPVFQLNGTIIANPIPTIGQWGLILLSMSLSIFGIVGMRQRVLV